MIKVDSLGLKCVFLGLMALVLSGLSSCQRDEGQKMFNQAKLLWENQKYEEAVQNFIALSKAFPDHPLVDDSLFWTANIYDHYLLEPKQAIRYYRSLTKKFEDSEFHIQAMINLAKVYTSEGGDGVQKAILIYQKLQKTIPHDETWGENQLELAKLYLQLKQYEQARVELKKVFSTLPDSDLLPKTYHLIGTSYHTEGKRELAVLSFEEADKKYNQSRSTLSSALSLAEIYEEQGELNLAIETYESILNRLKQNEIFYQLAVDRIEKLKSRLKKTNTG